MGTPFPLRPVRTLLIQSYDVLDGATVFLQGRGATTKLRLLGITVPPNMPEEFHRKSSQNLRRYMSGQYLIATLLHKDRGEPNLRYGIISLRTTLPVLIENWEQNTLNNIQVRDGFAVADSLGTSLMRDFEVAERQAKKNSAGLWSILPDSGVYMPEETVDEGKAQGFWREFSCRLLRSRIKSGIDQCFMEAYETGKQPY